MTMTSMQYMFSNHLDIDVLTQEYVHDFIKWKEHVACFI